MVYGGLEKDYNRLVKICPHMPSRESAKTGVIVEWEKKGENSVQFQDKQYFFFKPNLPYLHEVLPWKELFLSNVRAGSRIKHRKMARMQAWNIPGLP